MPLKRTPPSSSSTPATDNIAKLTKAKSDQDVSVNSDTLSPAITLRSKRPRNEFSPPFSEMEEFKSDIKNLVKELISNQSTMLSQLSADVAAIKIQNETIQKSNKDIEDSIQSIKASCVELKNRMEKFEKDRTDFQDKLFDVDKRVESLELRFRSSTIEIRNIPTMDNETVSDLYKIVSDTAKILNLEIQNSQIRDIYRLPSKPGKSRPIITEFSNVPLKVEIINALRKYNKTRPVAQKLNTSTIGCRGESLPVYISEYLPGSSRKLFYLAREYAKSANYSYCWAVNGKIYIRKNDNATAVRIDSEKALTVLKNGK